MLDCVIPHAFNPTSSDYINLQDYVIEKRKLKKLKELDALTIFYNIVSVVKNFHDVSCKMQSMDVVLYIL